MDVRSLTFILYQNVSQLARAPWLKRRTVVAEGGAATQSRLQGKLIIAMHKSWSSYSSILSFGYS